MRDRSPEYCTCAERLQSMRGWSINYVLGQLINVLCRATTEAKRRRQRRC